MHIFLYIAVLGVFSAVGGASGSTGNIPSRKNGLISDTSSTPTVTGDEDEEFRREQKPFVVRLPTNYSMHLPPPLINGQPVPIYFSLLLFNVFDIKELQGDLSLETNLKIYWRDTRLANLTGHDKDEEYLVLSPSLITQVWHPDAFVDHMKSVSQPSLISKAASLRLYPDGSLRYSARMIINLSCRMDFYFYPADTQRCHLDIKSYAYSTKRVTISWKGGKGPELAYPIDIHNFDVALDTEPDYIQNTRSASYSGIRFTLYLRRKLSYHIFQTFIPSALFTIVSWLSFLVPPESTPGRMAICVTTLLTLSAMFSSVRQNMPSTSYLKALDLWMLTCVVFVFTVIIEYTAVLKLRSMTVKEKKEPVVVMVPSSVTKSDSEVMMDVRARSVSTEPSPQLVTKRSNFSALDFNSGDGNPATVPLLMSRPMTPASPSPPATLSDSGGEKKKPTKYFILACKFEKYTPRIMPLLFLAFNLAYWPGLLISSDYYQLRGDKEMYYSV